MRLYVYYRIAAGHGPAALAALRQVCAGTAVELLRRPEVTDGLQTWMEVYPEGTTHLEPAVAAALQPWLSGARKVERFEPL